MTLQDTRIDPSPTVTGRPRRLARDTAVDVARAGCLLIVVALHAMMAGVGGSAAHPVFENAMQRWDGFAPLTWVVQVMPLFFVLGGFSALTQWTRMRERGEPASAYIASRLRRLLPPAIGAVAATAILLLGLRASGVPEQVIAEAGFRIGQPLWFLGVFLLCTGLVPAMVAAHRRHPVLTLGALAAVALAVDITRQATGVEAIGFANLLFVWLLCQQLGFLLADGTVDRMRTATIRRVGAGALAAAAVLCATGLASWSLFDALNPPSTVLALLGLAQLCAFALLRPRLRRLAERPRIGRAVAAVNVRAMTVYSWHMLVLILLAGALLLGGAALPDPLSSAWWASRPLWLAVVAAAVLATVRAAGRLEDAPRRPAARAVRAGRPTAALLAAAGAVLLILIAGREPLVWALAGAVLAGALRQATGSKRALSERHPTGLLSLAPRVSCNHMTGAATAKQLAGEKDSITAG